MVSVLDEDRMTDGRGSSFSASYPAKPRSVPLARGALTEFATAAGLGGQQLDAIRMACSEALTNTVVHAYRGRPGRIHVTAGILRGELLILIADDGVGMRTGGKHGGLGLGLGIIAAVSDSFEVAERANGGTEVRMRFALSSERSDDGQSRTSFSSARSPVSPRFSTIR